MPTCVVDDRGEAHGWLPMDKWDACPAELDPTSLEHRRCIAGLDLSTNTDLTALVLVFLDEQPVPVLAWHWIPEERLRLRVKLDRVPYDVWRDAGHIETTPGDVVDYDFIESRILELAGLYQIVEVCYDPYKAMQVAIHLENAGLTPVRVDQTFAQLNEAAKHLEALVLGARLNHGGNPVLRWNVENAAVKRNASAEIRPVKDDEKRRIDGIAALVTALSRVVRRPPPPPPPKLDDGSLDGLYEWIISDLRRLGAGSDAMSRVGRLWRAAKLGEWCSSIDLMPLEEMRLLDFVQWDRFVEGEREVVVYGWIRRDTLRDDFVVLTSVPAGVGFLTSSAKYSAEISRRLNGGQETETHTACQRVEDHVDLPNVIRRGPERSQL